MSQFLLLLLLILFSLTQIPLRLSIPDPDPSSIHLPFSSSSSPPATIPAFPEQSAAAVTCPLDLSGDLLSAVSAACSSSRRLRSRCCPAIAAALSAAYSTSALAAPPPLDLPLLPDDSESCVAAAEEAVRTRGVRLPRVNATCGLAYCYCGVRLRRLTCAGEELEREAAGRRLERECARPGLAGCSRCLRALNQLKSGNVTGGAQRGQSQPGKRECQLMGLTWLLSKNRTRYLPTATALFREFMAAGDPTSCSTPSDSLPIAVGSDEIDGDDSSAVTSLPVASLFHLILALVLLHIGV